MATSPAPQAAAPRSPRAARTRLRILDAAGQCFASHGFAKTTVEEIARTAGVSKGLVYHHFRGKEDLLEAVVDRTLTEWAEVSGEPRLEHAESVVEAIGDMHRKAIRYARSNPVLRALIDFDPLVLATVGQEPVRRSLEDFRVRLVSALSRGVASGELRADLDVPRAADVIRILHMGFIQQVLAPEYIDASDDALIEASLDVLFRGIARRRRR